MNENEPTFGLTVKKSGSSVDIPGELIGEAPNANKDDKLHIEGVLANSSQQQHNSLIKSNSEDFKQGENFQSINSTGKQHPVTTMAFNQPEVGSVIVEGGVRKSRRIGKLQHNMPPTLNGVLTQNLTIIAAPNPVEEKENSDISELVNISYH